MSGTVEKVLDNKDQVNWCLEKLQEAANDYNITAIKAYAEMARMWNNKEK